MGKQKTWIKTQDIVVMYTIQHLSSCEIQRLTGMSKTGIMKRLKSVGVKTKDGEWVNAICAYCGREYQVVRSRWKKSQKHYCKPECYYASLENPGYKPWREGQRIARAIIAQYFNLQDNHVIHHKDGDNRNNNLDNLQVFASQSDHLKVTHHNNGNIKPIWDGISP